MELNLSFTFDDKSYRHYMNGFLSVLHCHHYLCLTTKLAEDYDRIGGIRILRESAEDSLRPFFDSYLEQNSVTDPVKRLEIGARFYSVMGLGKMEVQGSEKSGEVVLTRSHVDQGWVRKWAKREQPVNHFTCGYISAMFSAAFGKPPRRYLATELSSIVRGSETSRFLVTLR